VKKTRRREGRGKGVRKEEKGGDRRERRKKGEGRGYAYNFRDVLAVKV
jgi:hypothetical protein